MLDIRFIRENSEMVAEKSRQKGYAINIQKLLSVDDSRRKLISEIERLRAQRNELSQSISVSPSPSAEENLPEDVLSASRENREKGRQLKEQLSQLEDQLGPVNDEYDKLLREVPNVTPDDTPLGGEEDNVEVKKWGNTADKGFEVKDHLTWGEERGLIDFERGAKVAGNKFYFLKGSLVELEQAIFQFGIAHIKEKDFLPMTVPHMASSYIFEGAGFSAKGEERQIYKVEDEDLGLIATAEIPLTGYHADEILGVKELPKLYGGLSPAYRVEAGAYGKHSRGLYRVHQFNKLELYIYCEPKDSEDWHQKLIQLEEEICQRLELPYRLVRIAAGDLGAPAYKKFDVEYWSAADKSYHELMSGSNVTDYQARRLNIRYKNEEGKTDYVHTLNATAAATSRVLIAIIENFQDKDGKVAVPRALQTYMHGQTHL